MWVQKDSAKQILAEVEEFLAKRGMEVSQKKTKVTASTDGFDFHRVDPSKPSAKNSC